MRLTDEQREKILAEIEALDYGRVVVEVCEGKYIDVVTERRVRIRKQTAHPVDTAHSMK
jgi:hypothetical protein